MPLHRSALLVVAALAAACDASAPTATRAPDRALAAKGGGGGGGTPAPAPATPMTGTWLGENRWGPGINEARRWTLTLTQSGAAFTGRLVTEMTTTLGTVVEGEGNVTVNGTLAGTATGTATGTAVTFTMRPKRGGSASTFIGTLSADGRTMTGVNWVPTIPATILGGPFTLTKQ
ncbi:MAG: hypothetical protein JO180_10410 [Gemmatirosa sp.]|nr:hypothetical protein [Gemmatirosa sp.]